MVKPVADNAAVEPEHKVEEVAEATGTLGVPEQGNPATNWRFGFAVLLPDAVGGDAGFGFVVSL